MPDDLTAPPLAVVYVDATTIGLNWDRPAEDPVLEYLVEACTGAGCLSFAPLATTPNMGYSHTGLARGTTMRYRVRSDLPGSAWSDVVTATTLAQPRQTRFVQDPYGGPLPVAPITLAQDVAAGSLLVLALVGWMTRTITGVTDTQGNVWAEAFARTYPGTTPENQLLVVCWYAMAGASGPLTVTATEVAEPGDVTTIHHRLIWEFDLGTTMTLDGTGTALEPPDGAVPPYQGMDYAWFSFADSGTQSGPGLLLALSTFGTSVFGSLDPYYQLIPAGFLPLIYSTGYTCAYRFTTTAEPFIGPQVQTYPQNTRMLGAMVAFRPVGGLPPEWPPGEPPEETPAPPTVAPSYGLDERIIRRLRRAPHVSQEHVRVFYKKFELDLERGVGLASGQGEDPLVLLRLSRDGGHTWSEPVTMRAGQLGVYTQRAVARRLGQARDCVFEVTVSDPVAWSLVQAWLDLEAGTH